MEGLQGKQSTNRNKCYFIGCARTKAKFPNLHFFHFPVNRPGTCAQWVDNCANTALHSMDTSSLKWKVVCERHFTQNCFTSLMKTKLTKEAVPTLFVDEEEVESQSDTNPNTEKPGPSNLTTIENGNYQQTTPPSSTKIIAKLSPHTIHPKSKKELFTNKTPPGNPQTIRTPTYKKLKSVKDRKSTPRKIISPRKMKLMKKFKQTVCLKKKYQQSLKRLSSKQQVISKNALILGMKAYLPPAVSQFFELQLNHCDKKTSWTADEKKQILKWRYKSPSLYDQMRNDGFALPAPRTISRWLEFVNLKPGICCNVMKHMEMKVECMTDLEKKAVVMLDEMAIKKGLEYNSKMDIVEGVLDLGEDGRKPIAGSNILLVMARGLLNKWKMPVAYYVTNKNVNASNIRDIIPKCVSALQLAGLEVKTVVCDQGSTNRKAAKLLGITKTRRKFQNEGKDIYLMYDFPHIVKCVRNNLMKQDKQGNYVGQISTSCGTVNWKYVVALYELDRSSSTARATKLTEKHICPNQFEKMSVKLATQVFSHTVATAMQTAVETNQLPIEAKETVLFIDKMNNIIDAMNSTTKFHPNPNKCALTDSKDPLLIQSLETIRKGINWVETWQMSNCSKRPPSFLGLQHTLTATLELWEDLKKEGVSFLLTNRLNQDPIENEFSIARQKCGYNRNPSARVFRLNMQHRIQSALMIPPAGSNCEPDEDQLLTTLTDGPSKSGSQSATAHDITEPSVIYRELGEEEEEADADDDWIADLPNISPAESVTLEDCSIRYFAGYAARACLIRFKCEVCKIEVLKQAADPPTPDELLIKNREYKSQCLTSPTDAATNVAKIILKVFDRIFTKSIHIVGIKRRIILKCKQWLFKEKREWMKGGTACSVHRDFFLDKMVTVMIKRKCQDISKNLRQPSGGKNDGFWRKVQNLQSK